MNEVEASNTDRQDGLTRPDVENQVRRIQESAVFQRASRSGKFLEIVVENWLDGTDPLSEAMLAERVFGRTDFDPRIDPIVRVEAARLRKRLQSYYSTVGQEDAIQIRLPQRGYWPEIGVHQNGTGPAESGAEDGNPDAKGPRMRLAVLPFANLGHEPSLDSFCAGLTEEVIASATDMADVAVVSRTSASVYEKEPIDLRSVGKSLGVTNVLEGSVRRGDGHLRVTATLVDSQTGFTVWSQTFERGDGGDPVDIQAAFGGLIAERLADRQEEELGQTAGVSSAASVNEIVAP